MTGFLLFCVISCAGWSDAQAATEVTFDASGSRAISESGTFCHQTARSSQQHSSLPYVGFCQLWQDKEGGTKSINAIEEIHKRVPNLPALLPAWSEQLWGMAPTKDVSGPGTKSGQTTMVATKHHKGSATPCRLRRTTYLNPNSM